MSSSDRLQHSLSVPNSDKWYRKVRDRRETAQACFLRRTTCIPPSVLRGSAPYIWIAHEPLHYRPRSLALHLPLSARGWWGEASPARSLERLWVTSRMD